MTLRDFLRLTRRRLGTILALTVLGVLVAAGLVAITPTRYTTQASAYVRVSLPRTTDAGAYYSASQMAGEKAKAFVPVFTSQAVAQAVVKQLGLHIDPADLAEQIKATNDTNSLTIDVTAPGDSPELARRTADAVVTQGAAQIRTLEGASSPVEVVMMAPATLSHVTKAPSLPVYLGAGLLLGLLAGYGAAFARSRFDTRLRTAEDVQEQFDSPVLAVLPEAGGAALSDSGATTNFQVEEAVRKLRTNLMYTDVDHQARVILVTSPLPGEGKSSVAAALARVTALAGEDVVLIDADLRRPMVGRIFKARGPIGLPQLLLGSVPMERALRRTEVPGLSVLPTFGPPPNPSEMLASARMSEFVRYLSHDHVVIIDSPPVLPVTDAAILSRSADAVVMVVSAASSRAGQLTNALSALERADGHVSGIVLNRAATSRFARMRYGDAQYGYGSYEASYHSYGSEGGQHDAEHAEDRHDDHREPARPLTPVGGTSSTRVRRASDDEAMWTTRSNETIR